MTETSDPELDAYYSRAESWSADREASAASRLRMAWIVGAVAAAVALIEAIAIVVMLPLRTVEPYTLLVDRQTGYVQALKPLETQALTPDEALVRSFLAQYVIAREQFDITSLQDTYKKVALWSQGDARSRYIAETQASNPLSKLATLPRQAVVEVQVRSLSMLTGDTALVRFATTRTDPGAQSQPPQLWAAVLKYRFSGSAMRAEDRLINPLGFQVVHYRRDAEMLAADAASSVPAAAAPGVRATAATPPSKASLGNSVQ